MGGVDGIYEMVLAETGDKEAAEIARGRAMTHVKDQQIMSAMAGMN